MLVTDGKSVNVSCPKTSCNRFKQVNSVVLFLTRFPISGVNDGIRNLLQFNVH